MSDETQQIDSGDAGADEHVSDLLGGYALGALDSGETEQVIRHLNACTQCQAELRDLEAAAGLLAYAAPAQHVPLRVRAGLLARVAEIGSDNPEQMVALPATGRVVSGPRHWYQRVPKTVWIASAPAAMLLVALSVSAILMQHRINDQQSELQSVEQDRGKALDVLAVDSNARFVSEMTSTGVAPGARARLFVDLTANNAMFVAIDLPAPADGDAYVAWLVLDGVYSRVGPLELDDLGRTQLIVEPTDSLDSYESFVVTLEPDPDATTPAGPEVFAGPIHPSGNSYEQLVLAR